MADALVPQDFLGKNDDTRRPKDRKQRNCIFRAIHHGKFEVVLGDFIDSSPSTYPNGRRVDPFTLTKQKRSKKAVASVSLEMVGGHMRCLVEDFGSAPRPSLLMSQHALKSMHELANAFDPKSEGEGNGAARFTRPAKTTLSGVRADERNVTLILVKPLLPPHGSGVAREGEVKGGRKIHPGWQSQLQEGRSSAKKICAEEPKACTKHPKPLALLLLRKLALEDAKRKRQKMV
ncbi:hypothetical protein EDB83DRAFT_2314151 [Lactarius deliciosus]|nr:hypothetical protein EDB83DRAFT_2314151 [Lactarius deliciosus]